MRDGQEKERLILNIIYFVFGCVLLISLVVFCIVISIRPKKNSQPEQLQEQQVNGVETIEDSSDLSEGADDKNKAKEFYIIDELGKVNIYEVEDGKMVFFDYASVEKSLMSDTLIQKIREGMYIHSEAELYEFLQTYSS